MLFKKKSVGISVSMFGIDAVLLSGKCADPVLERVANRQFSHGAARMSLKEPNIVDMKSFCKTVTETVDLINYKGKNIYLSLPDTAGRVVLMDVENRFKSRAEGLDIIRWKLKKSIPFDPADTHLDYQLVQTRQSGEMSLIVAIASKSVIRQYEDAFAAAGFNPTHVELEAFSICRCFNRQLEIMADGGLVYIYNNTIGIIVFCEGMPVFTRFKTIPESSSPSGRIRGEISNTMLAYRERFPEHPVNKLSCLISPEVSGDFCSLLEDICNVKPTPLDTLASVKNSAAASLGYSALFRSTASIGAAMRGI